MERFLTRCSNNNNFSSVKICFKDFKEFDINVKVQEKDSIVQSPCNYRKIHK